MTKIFNWNLQNIQSHNTRQREQIPQYKIQWDQNINHIKIIQNIHKRYEKSENSQYPVAVSNDASYDKGVGWTFRIGVKGVSRFAAAALRHQS